MSEENNKTYTAENENNDIQQEMEQKEAPDPSYGYEEGSSDFTGGENNREEADQAVQTGLADAETENDDPDPPKEKSFADVLYEEITSVIGGDNPNQFFCMGLPGTLVDATQYSYDIDANEPKPPLVEANESKLVNQLFDACKMTASDNGKHLQTQYKTALEMLTPKLNGKLFDAKEKLRKILMMPYPYNFGDGTPTEGFTLQQVFYKLYGDYVAAKQAWAQEQVDMKDKISANHPGGTAKENRQIQNEYLKWYETVAEAKMLAVEEKLGKVLNVFSPGDMEIITGILDSGAGREIAEARQILDNVERLSPDGGYVYPVTLYPENWFTLLDTSFTPIDLLESPVALSQKMSVLSAQKSNLTTQINTLLETIPDEKEVENLQNAYKTAEGAYNDALSTLQGTYTNVTVDMLKTFVDVMASSSKNAPEANDVPENATARIFGVPVDKVKDLIGKLGDSASKCLSEQQKLNTAATAATSAAVTYFEEKNLLQYKNMLLPLQAQLQRTEDEITHLQQQINVSGLLQNGTDTGNVTPNAVPDNFTQIVLTSKLSSVTKKSSSEASSSQSSYGVSFFFGGYSSSQSHQAAINDSFSNEADMEIQIGMSVAKVKIGREWFNPGVFQLTADMYNTSSEHIAPTKDYTGFTEERFNAMNQSVFPCFPTAFVIARDVTIRFSSSSSVSSSFAQSVEEHSARGGGFFIFGGSSSSSSSSSQSNSSATASSKAVTVRFTSPQILGYYLEATPTDHSTTISNSQMDDNTDFISIFDFIKDFQGMLDDYDKQYQKDSPSL